MNEYTSTGKQTVAKHCYPLTKLKVYGTIATDDRNHTQRKACGNDRDERANPHTGASCGSATSIYRYYHALNQKQEAESFQSRQSVEDNRNRYSRVLRATKQLRKTEGQIKKATIWWQRNDIVAASLALKPWKSKSTKPYTALPYVYHTHFCEISQGCAIDKTWAYARKMVRP